MPSISVQDLLRKYAAELKELKLDLRPDTPDIDPLLARLPALDARFTAQGGPSIFETSEQRLEVTGNGTRLATVETPVPGITAVEVTASGITTAGHRFTRLARLDIRT